MPIIECIAFNFQVFVFQVLVTYIFIIDVLYLIKDYFTTTKETKFVLTSF